MVKNDELLREVASYYSDKIIQFGESPRGVDWNSEDGQVLRFKQLCKVIDLTRMFSVNDLGCGYGALYDFLTLQMSNFTYCGIDVSAQMVQAASSRHNGLRSRFLLAEKPDQVADYGIASGVFNVRQQRTDAEWESYLKASLDILNESSRRGFAFNALTSYSDEDKKRADLYYADPCALFDFCKRKYSPQVSLLHDYGLYEFTILVRKLPL